jgi:hypothetical protein
MVDETFKKQAYPLVKAGVRKYSLTFSVSSFFYPCHPTLCLPVVLVFGLPSSNNSF